VCAGMLFYAYWRTHHRAGSEMERYTDKG